MFYSQFILAKKGPLGTIWIAAHLERKLRKNQVADTDIGVSVDSILFPDVPIALRLSSHLLLGVVRIYSRKVNYLFHDCSEALLQVKQAFRSTAVDLPPEESTAPYHSITLPETFDLDDFELPDNDIQGNYVDHHVSTREQITLQDTMEGVVYSTSQFGLDERFGDGDTSQIGLDLEEDLFLDKGCPSRRTAVLVDMDEDPQAFSQATTPYTPFPDIDMDDEENRFGEDRAAEASECMLVDINGEPIDSEAQNQMESDEPSQDLIGGAKVPSTPGLVDEDISANGHVQEDVTTDITCNLQLGSENCDSVKLVDKENLGSPSHISNHQNEDTNIELESTDVVMSNGDERSILGKEQVVQDKQHEDSPSTVVASDPVPSDPAGTMSSPTSVLVEQTKAVSPASECLDRPIPASESNPSLGIIDENCRLVNDSISHKEDVEPQKAMNATDAVGSDEPEPEKTEGANVCAELENADISTAVEAAEKGSPHNFMLRACSSIQSQPDLVSSLGDASAVVQGEEGNETMEFISSDDAKKDLTKSNEQLDANIRRDDNEEATEFPASSDLPAPEILLSAPEAFPDAPGDLLAESSPGKEVAQEGSGDELGNLLKRKRHLIESTPVLEDESVADLTGDAQTKRVLDSVPDDDDLLSSILVGRKSSVLKMKPTPVQPVIPAPKRRRATPQAGVPKRKMLIDDSMVLHGDIIRQQLTTTEDIRRLRKKAPCTRPEICMIEKLLLEEDFFSEPLFTGMHADLIDLHNGIFDISAVRITEIDPNQAPQEGANVEALSIGKDHNKEDDVEDKDDRALEPTETLLHTENELHKEHLVKAVENQVQTEILIDDQVVDGSCLEVDIVSTEVADTEQTNFDASSVSVPMDKEVILENNEKLHKPIEEDTLENEKEDDTTYAAGRNHDCSTPAEVASIQKDGSYAQESENGGLAETIPTIIPQEGLLENGNCIDNEASVASDNVNPSSEIDDHGKLGIERSELEVVVEDETMTEKVTVEDRSSAPDVISSEEPQRDQLCPSEIKGDEDAPLNRENVGFHESDVGRGMDEDCNALDTTMREPVDTENTMGGIDTEFLNFDDNEVEEEEEEDNDMPNTEEQPRIQENSGWSSRTRSVAKYLQTIFDKELANGEVRKVIPVDNLLSGKSRKEASRMFFETLVLKTRDYIHVEQEKPFANINIKPKGKLLKSDFGSIH
ncbi:hypothetical protein MKX01_011786 [Papaver californicum]|nr:hypothetical protein MKX01_011786 [Papaver californicum]